ncbi:hypothetical protein PC9H_006777 [Pleurotus ostreatus]|uniref:CCHC-type domain-containing protein n=1 Tax=Pleurotus ostreatus TaxID=5322 RepID=A0A8H7DUE5_PLEOS|nr:uncharacterized protein PC9H_006777 [Pleurotus ostreatus]KAF7431059.1 hypothetical protein PC9H_006777 [Pleurotus ostreatus]
MAMRTPSRGHSSPELSAQIFRSFRYTPDMMPMLGERGAPPLFKGSHEKVKSFLKKFNTLCARYSVTDSADKCERVLEYCSDKVVQLIEALPGYRSSEWDTLETEMKQHFDADRKETRNTICRLSKFTARQGAKKIKSLTQWKRYERKFITISGWLRKADKITENLEATYFWLGIHLDTRQKIENRLYARHSNISAKTAFPMKLVSEIALELFERDRFEFNLVSAGYDSEDESSDSDSDSDDDESEEDEDKVKAQLKALRSQKAHKPRARKSKAHDSAIDPVMEEVQAISPTYSSHRTPSHRKSSSGDSEVEDLIKKMSQMNIKDPDYAVTYYRAFCLDERIARIFPEPAKQAIQASNREFSRQASTTPRSSLPPPANQNVNPSTSQNFPPRPPLKCYGCGGQGHGLRRCPPLNDLVDQGIISRDSEGRYTWPNGEPIRRNFGEDYLPAIQRIRSQASPVVSNFITSFDPEDYVSEGEEEEEEAEEFLAELDPMDVLAAERAPKTVTMTRKDVLGKPSSSKARPTVNEETGRHTRSKGAAPEPRAGPNVRAKPSTSKIPALTNPVPADIRPRHEFTAEDIAMADDETPEPRKGNAAEAKPNDRVARAPRASARQAEILDPEEQEALFRRGLESTFQISLQEYLAVSKYAREQVMSMLKGRSMKIANENAVPEPVKNITGSIPQSFEVQIENEDTTKGPLIVVPMRFGKEIIHAVVDSGSQLNIIHADVYKKCIRLPVDTSKVLTMNDANGGSGELRGYVANVHLTCGSVDTVASLYLGHKAPFNLLLGRPWQRANRVSIEERDEGTYLVFRPRNETTKYELLVLETVNRPEQVLRSVFRKEDFAVNMVKPSVLAAAHSFTSFITTEPFSETQLSYDHSEDSDIESVHSAHISFPTSTTTLARLSSVEASSSTQKMVESSVNSTSSEVCEGPSELETMDQREPADSNIDLQELSYIAPPCYCLHSKGEGPLLGTDRFFCIKCWGDYLDECLLLDETHGNTEPEDEKESATHIHTLKSTVLPDRFGGHDGFTIDSGGSQWGDSTGYDAPSGFNSTSSAPGNVLGNIEDLHAHPSPSVHQKNSQEVLAGFRSLPPSPKIRPSEKRTLEPILEVPHRNLEAGTPPGTLQFFDYWIWWDTQEYPENGIPTGGLEPSFEETEHADAETQIGPSGSPEHSNCSTLCTVHPDSNCEGNRVEAAREHECAVSASLDLSRNPPPRQSAESGGPILLRDDEMSSRLLTSDFNLPLSAINSQEEPYPWERPNSQWDNPPRSSRILYDTLTRNSSRGQEGLGFGEALGSVHSALQFGHPWCSPLPTRASTVEGIRFVRKHGGDGTSQDSSPTSAPSELSSPLSEIEILQSTTPPTNPNTTSERVRVEQLHSLRSILSDPSEERPSAQSNERRGSRAGASLDKKTAGPETRARPQGDSNAYENVNGPSSRSQNYGNSPDLELMTRATVDCTRCDGKVEEMWRGMRSPVGNQEVSSQETSAELGWCSNEGLATPKGICDNSQVAVVERHAECASAETRRVGPSGSSPKFSTEWGERAPQYLASPTNQGKRFPPENRYGEAKDDQCCGRCKTPVQQGSEVGNSAKSCRPNVSAWIRTVGSGRQDEPAVEAFDSASATYAVPIDLPPPAVGRTRCLYGHAETPARRGLSTPESMDNARRPAQRSKIGPEEPTRTKECLEKSVGQGKRQEVPRGPRFEGDRVGIGRGMVMNNPGREDLGSKPQHSPGNEEISQSMSEYEGEDLPEVGIPHASPTALARKWPSDAGETQSSAIEFATPEEGFLERDLSTPVVKKSSDLEGVPTVDSLAEEALRPLLLYTKPTRLIPSGENLNQSDIVVLGLEAPPPRIRRSWLASVRESRTAEPPRSCNAEEDRTKESPHTWWGDEGGRDESRTVNETAGNVSRQTSVIERYEETRSCALQERALSARLSWKGRSCQRLNEDIDANQPQNQRAHVVQTSQATRPAVFLLNELDLDARGRRPPRVLAHRHGANPEARCWWHYPSELYWMPERQGKEFQTTKPSILNSATNNVRTYVLESPPLPLFNAPLDTVGPPSSKLTLNSLTSTPSLPAHIFQSHIASDMSSNNYAAVADAVNVPAHPQATIGRVIQTLVRTGMPPAYPVDRVPQPHISLPIQFPSGGQDQALLTAQRLQRYGLVQAAMTQAQPQKVAGVMSSNNFVEHQSHMVNNGKIRIYLANDAEVSRRSSIVPHLVERNRGTAYLILLESFDAPAVDSPPTPSHRLLDAFTFSIADSQYPYNIIVPPGVLSPRPVPAVVEPVVQRAAPTIRIPPRRHSFGEIDQNRDEDNQRPPRTQNARTRGTRRGGAPRQVPRRRSARLRGISASTVDVDHVSEPIPERQETAPRSSEANQQSFRSPVRTASPPGLPIPNDAIRHKNIEDLRNLQRRVRLGASSDSPSPPSDSTSHRTSSHASDNQEPTQPSLEPIIKEEYQSDPPILSLTLEDPKPLSESVERSPPRNQLALNQEFNGARSSGVLTTRYYRSPSPMESSEFTQPSLGTEGRPPSPVLGDVTMKDDTSSFHLPSPATSLPTPTADSPSISDNEGGAKEGNSEALSMTVFSPSESDINRAYASINIQDHITQLLRQVASEIAAEEGEVLVPSSSPAQDTPPMGSSAAKGAKKPRFGSPIGSRMDRRKAIRSRPPPSKGKGSTSSSTLNQPPLQHAFHVWRPESGEGPVLIMPDSDSEEATEFFKNAVVVEESEDSFVVQVPQGSHGLAAAMNSAFQHNHQMLQELLDEEKENVPPGSEVVVGMETTSKYYNKNPNKSKETEAL